jgi:hypothetical protein
MKPGDLVDFTIDRFIVNEGEVRIGLIVDVQWHFDQVSEPHALADVLVGGDMILGIPHEWLKVIDETR